MEKVQDGITFYPEKAGVYVSTAPIVPIIDNLYVINANDIYWGEFDGTGIKTTGQFIKWIKNNKGIVGPSNNNSNYYVITSSENISYPVDKELDKSYTIGLKLYENTSEKTISSIEILNKPYGVKEITQDTHLTNIIVTITKNTSIDNKAIFLKVSDTDNNTVIVKIPINIYKTSETGQPIVQQSGKITVSGSGNVYNDISTLNFKSGFDIEKENDNTTNINVSTAAFVTTNGDLKIKGLKTFVDGIKVKEGTSDYVVLANGSTKKLSDISGSGNGGINITYPGTNPPLDQCNTLLFNRDDFKLEQDHNTILVSLIKNSTPTTPTTTTTGGINAIDLYKWDIILEFETSESGIISNIKNKDYLSFRITKNGSLLRDVTESFDSDKITKPSNLIEYIDGTYTTSDEIHNYYGIRTICDENCYKLFFKNLKTKFPELYNNIFNNIFNDNDNVYLNIVNSGTKITLNPINITSIVSDVRSLAEDLLTRYNKESDTEELNCKIYGQPTGDYSGKFGFIWYHNNIKESLANPSLANPDIYRYDLGNTNYGTSKLSNYYIYPIISDDMKKEYKLVIGTLYKLWYECSGNHTPFDINEFKIKTSASDWDYEESDGTSNVYTPWNCLRLISDRHPQQQGEETETKTVYIYNNPTEIKVSKREYNLIEILTDIICKMLVKPYTNNNIKAQIKNDSRKLALNYSDENFRTILNHIINAAGMNIDILQIKFLKALIGKYIEKKNNKYYINRSVLEDYVIHRYINILQSFCGRSHMNFKQGQIRGANYTNYTFAAIEDITIYEDTESNIIKYFDNEDYNIIINYEKGEYDLTKLAGRLLITFPDSKLKYNKYFNSNDANDLGTIRFYVGDSLLISNMWFDTATGFDENRIYYTDSDGKAGYKNEQGLVYNNDGKYNSLIHKMYHYFGLENEIERNIIQRMVMISNGFDPIKYSRKLKEGYLINIVEEINDLINTINNAHNSENIIGEKYRDIKNEYEEYYNDNISYFSYIFEGIAYIMPNDELSNININIEYLDNPTDPNATVNIRRLSIAMAKVESERYKLMYNRNVYENVPENYNNIYYYENGEIRLGYPTPYPGESIEVMYADLIYRQYQENGLIGDNITSYNNRNNAIKEDIAIINSNYIKGSIVLPWNEINN